MNWGAIQAAKKPKSESVQLTDTTLAGPSMFQDPSLRDNSLAGIPSSFSTFTMSMSAQSGGAPLSLDSMTGTFNPPSHSEWPQGDQSQAGYASDCIKHEPLNTSHQQGLSLQASVHHNPSAYKTDKTVDVNIVKQELKGANLSGHGKHQSPTSSSYPLSAQPPPPQLSLTPKLPLDKYREKHTIDFAVSGQKVRHEQHAALIENNSRGKTPLSSNASSLSHGHHKNSHTDQISQSAPALGSSSNSTASPLKSRVPVTMDRCHHSDKWDKSLVNLHLAIPGSGGSFKMDRNKEEFKMKIRVSSSERHSSSDEGTAANNKSKHSSPLVSKEKQHRSVEHNLHRHHKYSHSNLHSQSGNGQGSSESSNSGGGLLRGAPGLITIEGIALPHSGSTSLTSSSSRKRAHLEANHNQHHSWSSTSCSKMNKISKGGTSAAGGLRTSQQYLPPNESPHEVGDQRD